MSALAFAIPASAQETAPEAAAEDGQEIIVTAQKRKERLQDVPLAVSAISSQMLETRNITDTTNLSRVSPTLTYTQSTNQQNSSFRIRGIGTAVFSVGSESSVSVVTDGVVLARSSQGFADLADIERVEVLRGPQGTLFGKNATAGVISIVTARPTRDLSGKFSASVAEEGQYKLMGTVSGPLGNDVGLRLTGFFNHDDGVNYNTTLKKRTNGSESWGLRGKLEFDLGNLNLLGSASYSKTNSNCCNPVPVRIDNPQLALVTLPVVAGLYNMDLPNNLEGDTRITNQIYSLEGRYDLGAATITSITALQKFAFYNNQDVDGYNTNVPRFIGASNTAYAQFDINGGTTDIKDFSQELRIASNGSNRLNYVAGIYYDKVNLVREFQRRVVFCPTTNPLNTGLAIGAVCPAPVGNSGSHHAEYDAKQIAAFGQIDLRLTGGLKAIAGIRAQHQSIKAFGYQNADPYVAGDTPAFSGATLTRGTTTASDDAISGKAGLQYEFSRNAQIYATYTRGYKGQSLGTEYNQTFNNNPVAEPETVNAYEIGFKGTTADRTFSISVAGFIADYQNLQIQANKSDTSGTVPVILFIVTNAGESRTRGIEIEGTIRPDEHFSLGFGAAYVHGRFDADGVACPLQNQAAAVTVAVGGVQPVNTCYRQTVTGTTLSGRVQNIRNGILPNSPTFKINLNPRYEREVGANLTGYVDVNLAFQSKVNFSVEQDPLLVQPAFTTVDASIGIRPREGHGLSASVWVRNLLNEHYYSNLSHAATLTSLTLTPNNLSAFYNRGASRYFGATVGMSF
ncbi:TonB-dependent receptor [Sphingorhabdus contaminans]|uniref:TonB-dependent receptor n=1 Tax=Sphingorhabdus contaminans TaxID=1343899 RepID=UPI003D2A7667